MFFFTSPATTTIYTLSLHDALPISTPINHRESLSPRIKSLNYLSHILAKVEGIAAGVDEVIMLDISGYVDRKSTRLNSSHPSISYAVFCLKKKKKKTRTTQHRTNSH